MAAMGVSESAKICSASSRSVDIQHCRSAVGGDFGIDFHNVSIVAPLSDDRIDQTASCTHTYRLTSSVNIVSVIAQLLRQFASADRTISNINEL
jgi:hypothetical protein